MLCKQGTIGLVGTQVSCVVQWVRATVNATTNSDDSYKANANRAAITMGEVKRIGRFIKTKIPKNQNVFN